MLKIRNGKNLEKDTKEIEERKIKKRKRREEKDFKN